MCGARGTAVSRDDAAGQKKQTFCGHEQLWLLDCVFIDGLFDDSPALRQHSVEWFCDYSRPSI